MQRRKRVVISGTAAVHRETVQTIIPHRREMSVIPVAVGTLIRGERMIHDIAFSQNAGLDLSVVIEDSVAGVAVDLGSATDGRQFKSSAKFKRTSL